MRLIVGLGNPGRLYTDSRHNIGFSVIKALSQFYKVNLKKDSALNSAFTTKCRIENQSAILAMPLTFMNLSGWAVSALLKKYKIGLGNLLVVCDDLDLEFGRIKIRPRGSSAGHKGLQSIIDSLGTREFSRLRIGIGRPPHQLVSKNVGKINWCGGRPKARRDAREYVLSSFNRREKARIKDTVEKAVECCRVWVRQGITKTMNIFNQRSGDE